MDWQEANRIDVSLLPFLKATDEMETEGLLAKLVSQCADPTIEGIVRGKLRVSLRPADGSRENQDALEVISDVHTLLLTELRALKSNSNAKTISNFRGYVAVVTYHACYQCLRQKYPERWRLKNKLRYLLTHRPIFALWESNEGEFLCGPTAWRDQGTALTPSARSQQLRERLQEFLPAKLSGKDTQPVPLAELLISIFKCAHGPVPLDDLVNIVADLCGIDGGAVQTEIDDDRIERQNVRLANQGVDVATAMEQHMHLEQLWREICQLPVRHRAAILLNLRDEKGRGVITLLPLTRVATIRQIAAALEFSLENFARVWNELPWDDATIAQHLGLRRQQVINLRHSARTRLARRVKGY